jgi:hypothetical protein
VRDKGGRRRTGRHVPHDSSVREGSESAEGLLEDLVVDLGGKVSDEDVEVALGVLQSPFVRIPTSASTLGKMKRIRRGERTRTSLFCWPW